MPEVHRDPQNTHSQPLNACILKTGVFLSSELTLNRPDFRIIVVCIHLKHSRGGSLCLQIPSTIGTYGQGRCYPQPCSRAGNLLGSRLPTALAPTPCASHESAHGHQTSPWYTGQWSIMHSSWMKKCNSESPPPPQPQVIGANRLSVKIGKIAL